MFKKTILLFFLLIIEMGCSQTSKEAAGGSPAACTSTSPDHWSTGVSAIIQNNCVGCHSNFSTYSGASASASSISSQVNSGSMPKGGTLSAADKAAIVQWASCGAPQ